MTQFLQAMTASAARYTACMLVFSVLLLASGGAPPASASAAAGASSRIRAGIVAFSNGGDFADGKLYAVASATAKVVDATGRPVHNAVVTWSVERARNNSPAMRAGWHDKKTGLTWGNKPESGRGDDDYVYQRLQQERIVTAANNTSAVNADGESTMQLTDIVGERVVTVKATVNADGVEYGATQEWSFGKGPLSVFRAAPEDVGRSWEQAYQYCNGVAPSGADLPGGWTFADEGDYHGGGKLPTREEVQAVSPIDAAIWGDTTHNVNAQGAAWAAGWLDGAWGCVWTGEAGDADGAYGVCLGDGFHGWGNVDNAIHAVCRR